MRRMPELLKPNDWEATRSLFAPMGHQLALGALLGGAVPGEVYADDAARPTVALAWVQQRLFLAGLLEAVDGTDALRDVIANYIGPRVLARGRGHLALYAEGEAWPRQIESGLKRYLPLAAERHYYVCRLPRPARPLRLPEGYSLRPVDRELLEKSGLAHRDALMDEMRSERPSVEEFLAKSFGVCAVRGDALAGWCLSEYDHTGACEVGIETLPEHRGQGLATAMTLEFVARAAAQGLTRVGWHCYARNEASVATALAAGFERVAGYRGYVLDLEAGAGDSHS
jgi:GNAT superfamily N-acetyltransferase